MMPSLNIAYLPGVGPVENPEPRHYAEAIRFLNEKVRRLPAAQKIALDGPDAIPSHPELRLLLRLRATLRRIVWTNALRARREERSI
jgi:hypothetical protein